MASPPPNPINHPPPSFNVYIFIIIATFLLILLCATLLIYSSRCVTAESLWRCLTCRISRGPVVVETVQIPVCRYREEQSFSSECSVCLTAFEEGEKVRQLPSCRHSFHAACVDMWLCSNPSCPSCRAPVLQVLQQRIEDMEDSSQQQQQQQEEGNREVAIAISSVV